MSVKSEVERLKRLIAPPVSTAGKAAFRIEVDEDGWTVLHGVEGATVRLPPNGRDRREWLDEDDADPEDL